MEQLSQNYEQWITQWKAIEHPKNISLENKLKEYRKWRNFWDFWCSYPSLTIEQAKKLFIL